MIDEGWQSSLDLNSEASDRTLEEILKADLALTSATFITDIAVIKRRGRRADDEMLWKTLDPLIYYSAILDQVLIVPAGFLTDFASVPRLPLAYILTGDTVHAPAVLHDWMTRTDSMDRRICDKIFLEAMKADRQPWWRRTIMYWAVALATTFGMKNGSGPSFEAEDIDPPSVAPRNEDKDI